MKYIYLLLINFSILYGVKGENIEMSPGLHSPHHKTIGLNLNLKDTVQIVIDSATLLLKYENNVSEYTEVYRGSKSEFQKISDEDFIKILIQKGFSEANKMQSKFLGTKLLFIDSGHPFVLVLCKSSNYSMTILIKFIDEEGNQIEAIHDMVYQQKNIFFFNEPIIKSIESKIIQKNLEKIKVILTEVFIKIFKENHAWDPLQLINFIRQLNLFITKHHKKGVDNLYIKVDNIVIETQMYKDRSHIYSIMLKFLDKDKRLIPPLKILVIDDDINNEKYIFYHQTMKNIFWRIKEDFKEKKFIETLTYNKDYFHIKLKHQEEEVAILKNLLDNDLIKKQEYDDSLKELEKIKKELDNYLSLTQDKIKKYEELAEITKPYKEKKEEKRKELRKIHERLSEKEGFLSFLHKKSKRELEEKATSITKEMSQLENYIEILENEAKSLREIPEENKLDEASGIIPEENKLDEASGGIPLEKFKESFIKLQKLL